MLCTCVALHDGNITASFAKGMNAMSATTSETILGGNGYNLKAKNVKRVIYTTYRHTAWKHLPTFPSGKAEESKTTTQKDVQLF